MDQNSAAVRALHEYANIKEPRYAFMIEAPWGAGKTYLVKREFKDALKSEEARYVTLNGVSDQKSFRRALLADKSEANLIAAARKLGDTIGTIARAGNIGSLLQDIVEDRMIDNLPNLIIFDDVERCEMSPGELLGLINDFVEHQAKNVVLCAFIERGDLDDSSKEKRDDFLSRKEKVVGRTVRIAADARDALPEFISAMPRGHGKEWFKSHEALVLEVFSRETHSNLRVLRQCLHDCGRVIDVLEEELRVSTDAMIRVVRTYLVLAMAVATGEMASKQLRDRRDYRIAFKPKDAGEAHPLSKCLERHPHAEIFAGNAESILPSELGNSLIGIGYCEPDNINAALRATGQFIGDKSIPLWARFVKWRRMSQTDLENTHKEAQSYIFENTQIEAGPFLHVAHGLISIAEDGAGEGAKTAKKIEDRIKELDKSGRIPPAEYGRGFGWDGEMGGFVFGGYGFESNDLTKPIIDLMRESQIRAFEERRDSEGKRLLDLFSKKLEAFTREFAGDHGRLNYYGTAILHKIDANLFAKAVFSYVTSGEFEALREPLKAITDRHAHGNLPEELAWAKNVKAKLEEYAEQAGHLERARMVGFLESFWKFPMDAEGRE